jgi:hypothetical protein
MASADLFRVNYVRKIIPNDHNLFAVCKRGSISDIGLCLHLNSTFAALSRELLGRTNLGEGGLKTEGVDWSLLLVPKPDILAEIEKLFGRTDGMFRRRIGSIGEEVIQPDKIRLDELLFEMLGLRKKMRVTLAEATVSLVRRRIEKAISLRRQPSRERIEAAEKTRGIWAG